MKLAHFNGCISAKCSPQPQEEIFTACGGQSLGLIKLRDYHAKDGPVLVVTRPGQSQGKSDILKTKSRLYQ